MKKVRTASKFRRDFKLAKKRGRDIDILTEVVELLREGEILNEMWKDHGLRGDWIGSRECHLTPDWMLIYEIAEDEIILQRTGSHSDLFG